MKMCTQVSFAMHNIHKTQFFKNSKFKKSKFSKNSKFSKTHLKNISENSKLSKCKIPSNPFSFYEITLFTTKVGSLV